MTEAPKSPRRAHPSQRRWILAALLLCILLGVGLLASGWFPQERLRLLAERQIRQAIGPGSRIGALHVVPGKLYAQIDDLVVDGPTYRIEAPHARVRANWGFVLGRGIDLRTLEAEGARITLRPPPPDRPPAVLPSVRVESVRITDATVVYSDPALEGDVRLDHVAVSGAIGSGTLVATAAGGAWQRSPVVPLGPVSARAQVSPELVLDLEAADAGTARSHVHASGRLQTADPGAVDLKYSASLDLGELASFAPRPVDVEGVIESGGSVGGTLKAPVASGTVSGARLVAGEWPIDRLDARFAYDGAAASSADWTVAALGGTSTGMARLERGRVTANARIADIDTRRLPPSASATGLPPTRLSGTARATGPQAGPYDVVLDARGAGSEAGRTHTLAAHGTGRVDPAVPRVDLAWNANAALEQPGAPGTAGWRFVRFEAKGDARGPLPPVVKADLHGIVGLGTPNGAQEVALAGTLRNQGASVTAHVTGEGLGGTLEASVDAERARIRDLTATARSLDLSPLAAGAAGRLDVDVRAAGPFDRLDGTGALRASAVVWQGVRVGDATADLTADDGVGAARFAVPALVVTGDARLDAQGVQAHVVASETPLAALQPLVPEGRTIGGTVSATGEVRALWSDPAAAEATAHVTALALVSGARAAAATRPFDVAWRGERLHVAGLDVEGEGLHVRADATLGVRPEAAIEGRVVVEGDLAQLPLPTAWRVSGAFAADVALAGTRVAPRATGAASATEVLVTSAGGVPLLAVPEGRIDLAGDRVRVAGLEAEIAGGTLTVDADAPLEALLPAPEGRAPSNAVVTATAAVDDVDAGALASALRDLDVAVEGTLSARLAVEVLPATHEIRGTLEAPATTVRVGDLPVQLGALRVHGDGRKVTLEPWTIGSRGSQVVTQATVDARSRAIDATSRGAIDLRALSPLLEQAAMTGQAQIDVTVGGTLAAPRAHGGVTVADGALRLREIPQAITRIDARALLEGKILRLEHASAEWGGGTLELTGSAGLAADAPVDLKLAAREVALRYPRDFRSRLRADLTVTGKRDALLLAGEVHAERGLYDTDIFLEDALLAPTLTPAAAQSSFLQAIALDLTVVTDRPVLVRNNLAELEASGRLRVRGDALYPAPFGRLEVREGGKVFLQTREFTIRNGSLTYNGTLDPEVALTAETVIPQQGEEDVQVTATASGPLTRPMLDLRSDPAYSEREIASLVATGRRGALDSVGGAAWTAGGQTAVLLAGRVTRNIARGFRDLGLDQVDIQPSLLAREDDPGARFTFGKFLTPSLKLVYSIGLNDPEARFFQAQYRFRLGREITAKIQRDDDGTYTYGVGQRIRWGGPPRGTRAGGGRRRGAAEETAKLTEVRIVGLPGDVEARAKSRVRARVGSDVTFWRLQDDAERLQDFLRRETYLEALVSADLDGTVAVIDARPGARYRWTVAGLTAPPDLTDAVRGALFEEEALEHGREALLGAARARGYPRARVETDVVAAEGTRTLAFTVEPGAPATVTAVTFPGAGSVSPSDLLSAAGGPAAVLSEPGVAREHMEKLYRDRQYLTARVEAPRVQESEDRASVAIEVRVTEGPQALLGDVFFEGVTLDETELADATKLETGHPYDPAPVEGAIERVRAYYLERGYASVRVLPRVQQRETDLDLVLKVVEGEPQVVGDIVFTGLLRTKESTVRRVVPFEKGKPLDPRKLALFERRLLDLDVFNRAVVTASSDPEARIEVALREQGHYTVQYDVRHNPTDGPSGLLDGEIGNIAGTALAAGARYRAGKDVRELRGSLHLPAIGRSADLTASVFREDQDFFLLRELDPGPSPPPVPQDTERQQGFQIQQSFSARTHWDVLYGYRFKHIESLTRDFDQNLSGVELSLLRETRDNPIDARVGTFLSFSIEVAPSFLGSEFQYYRALGQVFLAKPVGRNLTWAQGFRLGIGNGLDDQVLQQSQLFGRSTEAFRAGGANTLRGYATDSVGPDGPIRGLSRGGQALAIMNQELRYRHPSGLGLAAFYDVGNVYADIDGLKDLSYRHSIGGGLRYESPIGLLRLDVGVPLAKRPSDRGFQWFFSLGQAF
jgi:outer membrane protein insertion porin family